MDCGDMSPQIVLDKRESRKYNGLVTIELSRNLRSNIR
jgi:hypothetical protein